jgi:glucose/mannose-6-phosphate isomerase
MIHPLDDLNHLNNLDSEGMLTTLEKFPDDCVSALRNAEKIDLSKIKKSRYIVICGMGGSAIGGLLLQDWLHDVVKIPIMVSRGYQLPGFVNSKTIIIAVSYSGNTEETLRSIQQSKLRKAQVITVTSGGQILQISREEGYPCIQVPLGFQPRAALPYQFFSLVQIAEKLDLFKDKNDEIEETIHILKNLGEKFKRSIPIKDNPAKEIANKLIEHVPFVVTPGYMKSVAYRISTQFNENSKIPAFSSFIPEAFHNRVMAVEAKKEILDKIYPIIVKDPNDQKLENKITAFTELLKNKFGKILEIETFGTEKLAKMFSTILLCDFASTYLGVLYGKNPTPLNSIKFIKDRD